MVNKPWMRSEHPSPHNISDQTTPDEDDAASLPPDLFETSPSGAPHVEVAYKLPRKRAHQPSPPPSLCDPDTSASASPKAALQHIFWRLPFLALLDHYVYTNEDLHKLLADFVPKRNKLSTLNRPGATRTNKNWIVDNALGETLLDIGPFLNIHIRRESTVAETRVVFARAKKKMLSSFLSTSARLRALRRHLDVLPSLYWCFPPVHIFGLLVHIHLGPCSLAAHNAWHSLFADLNLLDDDHTLPTSFIDRFFYSPSRSSLSTPWTATRGTLPSLQLSLSSLVEQSTNVLEHSPLLDLAHLVSSEYAPNIHPRFHNSVANALSARIVQVHALSEGSPEADRSDVAAFKRELKGAYAAIAGNAGTHDGENENDTEGADGNGEEESTKFDMRGLSSFASEFAAAVLISELEVGTTQSHVKLEQSILRERVTERLTERKSGPTAPAKRSRAK